MNLDHLHRFLGELQIDTKEMGPRKLTQENLLGTQRMFLHELNKGLAEGIHHFVVLKGRQAGITTFMMALNLYWAFMHKGIGQTLVQHDEATRDMLRQTLMMYYASLPEKWRVPMVQSNRNQVVFRNRSRMMYQINSKKNDNLGRGKAINYAHCTEAAFWKNPDSIDSLENSFSQSNPNRLYIFESTANGYNHFHDMWKTAKKATARRAIFIPWWVNELYSCAQESPEYKTYWDGRPTPEEREWLLDIKRLYKVSLTGEQMAWWRWMAAEKVLSETQLLTDHPPTENYAFQLSGSNFFSAGALNDALHLAKRRKPEYYRVHFGMRFEETKLVPCGKELATLKVWEKPQDGRDCYYAIGADPAHGSNEWKDGFALQVYRVYADGMDQVAEYCATGITTANFAWVISFLAGAYGEAGTAELNLEVNGPGQSVLQELDNMKRQSMSTSSNEDKSLYNVVRHMRYYNYRRMDSASGSRGAIGWLTTSATKQRMMNNMRDAFTKGMLRIYSHECIAEMQSVVQDGPHIEAQGKIDKDDRVVATALAVVCWIDKMRINLVQRRIARPAISDLVLADAPPKNVTPMAATAQKALAGYLSRVGMS